MFENYESNVLAFYDWIDAYPLPAAAISLWHAFARIADGAGYPRSISPSMETLKAKAGLSKDEVLDARDILQDAGLIVFNGGSYTLHSLPPRTQISRE